MRLIAPAMIATCLLTARAPQAQASPFTGHFEGTGRACYGTLAIQPKAISWVTPFSRCESRPYELVGEDRQKVKMKMAYRLKGPAGTCRYAILTLKHIGLEKDTGWEVTGYGSEQSYKADKSSGYKKNSSDMMSCSLIRTPDE